MQNNYAEALVEVNEILKLTDPNLTQKIPSSFKNFIINNMSNTYKFDVLENFSTDDLKEETKSILALIYRNYFCSSEEKAYLLKKEFLERKSHIEKNPENITEKENLQVKNIDEIFTNSNISSDSKNIEQETNLIEYKEKWYIKLLEKLLKKLKSI